MGLCWSGAVAEPPVKQSTVIASAPPYAPPPQYNPTYTYAVKPGQAQESVYYNYPPQMYQQTYPQQYVQPYPSQYQMYPPQQRPTPGGNAATAFVGGMLMGAIVEDILDPIE